MFSAFKDYGPEYSALYILVGPFRVTQQHDPGGACFHSFKSGSFARRSDDFMVFLVALENIRRTEYVAMPLFFG